MLDKCKRSCNLCGDLVDEKDRIQPTTSRQPILFRRTSPIPIQNDYNRYSTRYNVPQTQPVVTPPPAQRRITTTTQRSTTTLRTTTTTTTTRRPTTTTTTTKRYETEGNATIKLDREL